MEARVIRIVLAASFVSCLLAVPLAGQTAPQDVPRIELQSLNLGLRYRMLENHLGSQSQNWSDHHQSLKLRLKLEDDPGNPLYFQTVHGTGYKFVPTPKQ